MYRQIKMELKNCINQMEFKFIFSILWCISIGGFIINCFMYKNSYYQFLRAANENFILVSTSTRAIIIVLALFFPLLAMSIYSGSFKKEERSNLTQLIILRTSKKRYIWSKAIAIFIITFLSFLIPLLINQLLCYLTFPIEGFDNRWALPNYDLIRRYENTDLFDFFRIQYPFIYNLLYILIYSTLGGIIALLAYGVNFVQKFKSIKELQVNIIIFVIFMLSSFSSQILKIPIMDFLSYALGIITKNSFKGNIYFKELVGEDNLDDYQVQVYPVNEYFDNNITDIHDLEKKSNLIAKVQVQEDRKLFLQSTKTKVKIICKYHGSDDYKEGSIIYIEEPSVFLKGDNLTYDVTYGYQIMEDNKEYIVFLKNLEKVDNYKYKNDEKYTFIPVSTLYAKYPLEKENVKVIEQSKVEQGECKYGDIKNNSILSFKLEEVEKFKKFLNIIEQEYLK